MRARDVKHDGSLTSSLIILSSQTPVMVMPNMVAAFRTPGRSVIGRHKVLREGQDAGTDVCGGDGAATWS